MHERAEAAGSVDRWPPMTRPAVPGASASATHSDAPAITPSATTGTWAATAARWKPTRAAIS